MSNLLIDKPMNTLPDPRCEQCEFYRMIDSAYGWCIGNPPSELHRKSPWWIRLAWFFYIYIEVKDPRPDYPFEGYRVVPWDIVACRLFKKRSYSI